MNRFATEFAQVQAIQLVAHLRQEEQRERVRIVAAATWLAALAA